jgi:glycosyltransferase involved in cell wall biosynthesis
VRLIPQLGGSVQRAQGCRDRPLSVCFVIDRLTRAGTETQLLALIRHLDRAVVRPSLCLLDGDNPDSRALLPPNCPSLTLGLKALCRPSAVPAAVKLAAFWRRNRVDVVQTYFIDSTYFAAPFARLCGIRHVVQVRNNVGYWLTPVHRLIGRTVGRLTDVILTNSDAARRAILATAGHSPRRVRLIENGVDLERFPPGPPPDTSRAVVRIGAVANLRPVKNIDGLVRVARRLCRDDSRLHFEVAGDGEQRPVLESAIHEAGLERRFILRGPISDIPAFLASLDVAVLCSHSESMSNALLEYMAAGRAIVATDVGANARLVRGGREGIIVATEDEALTRGIRTFLQQPELARETATAARARAQAEFSRAAMIRRFEDFYKSLGQRPGRNIRGPAKSAEDVDS